MVFMCKKVGAVGESTYRGAFQFMDVVLTLVPIYQLLSLTIGHFALLPLYFLQTYYAHTHTHPHTRTQCKKAFRKDMSEYEEADEYCPHCDNQYVIEAKEPKAMVGVEGEDARVDNRMLKDDRMKEDPARSLFASKDVSDKVDQSLYELLRARQAAGGGAQ
nr:uncharacterized protein CI109_007192 [Kwoniella shandongensis]KAA5524485.1 hypothetical protein CI109_007192 [Kwoniella shandongensis]